MSNIILEAATEQFWLTSTQLIQLVVPIIGIVLVFKIIYDFLLKEK